MYAVKYKSGKVGRGQDGYRPPAFDLGFSASPLCTKFATELSEPILLLKRSPVKKKRQEQQSGAKRGINTAMTRAVA